MSIIFATQLGGSRNFSALWILLYIAFGTNLVGLAVLAFLCTFFVKKLSSHTLGSKRNTWILMAGNALAEAVSIIVSGVALVWLATRQNELPAKILQVDPIIFLGVWFAAWAVASVLQMVLYCLLHIWTKNVLNSQRASRLDLDFRTRVPSVSTTARPVTKQTNRSFGSQDLTLASPPRTPVSRYNSSPRWSSSTRAGQGSSKTKLYRYSNRSSLEVVPFPAGEAMSVDSAFDNWDTSSVHHEMRAAIHSSPPVTRGGLETIPGSRPESAAEDGFLPQSPISSSPPHAATSDTATVFGWSSSPRAPKSSPPSSPINFSRPTSKPGSRPASRPTSSYKDKPLPKVEAFDPTMQELIHPLFRPTSPHPPPIATAGTIVTASPMADTLLTPKKLARLRSNSHPPPTQWEQMPSADKSETESIDKFVPDSPTLGSSTLGSPGPSLVDEAELPPILPGFVLSAGSRSSLTAYGKRKSLKREKTRSTGSLASSRLSQVMT
jgi:hypothetical protein